ncbi:MAG: hypothetical protein HY043_05745 [Verrucomicrobia bacterium]|nr:hypothetical protein [Verrucomicrobiota bacterium]
MTFRLGAFALAIVMVVAMIAWAAVNGWRRIGQLNRQLNKVQIESFRIADRFQATIQQLDYHVLRYEFHHEPADLERLLTELKTLDGWIDEQTNKLTSPLERKILNRINDVYDEYQSVARQVGTSPGAESSQAELKRVEGQSKRLLELGLQLANAHGMALNAFLSSSQNSLLTLGRLVFAALVLLILLVGLLAFVLYRDLIAPLKMQLVESHAIIERQEKLASLGVLAAGVAHEIRNPLTAIKARLFTQQKLLAPGSPASEDAKVIDGEINRLERIVKDVLHFARPADPKLAPTAVQPLLCEVRDLLAPQLERGGIALKLESSPEETISADPQQLKQVLINLVQNAAESIEHHGSVTLAARLGTERLHGKSSPVIRLEVTDTGKGISAEVQKRLFDPFFSTKHGGTGLGLAIAARIVEKHGGLLEFQTRPQHGTTFGIILPRGTPP